MLRPKRKVPARPTVSAARVPSSLEVRAGQFLAWSVGTGLSPDTARIRAAALDRFVPWCEARQIHAPEQLGKESLEEYFAFLQTSRRRDGEPIAEGTRLARFNPVIAFCKWMFRNDMVLDDPCARLLPRKAGRRLPPRVPTRKEMFAVLSLPDASTPSGIRDRAILEVLYATGLRRMELVRLRVLDVDAGRQSVRVLHGKGNRDRQVPMGPMALDWLVKYLHAVRPMLTGPRSFDTLFLTDYGEAFGLNRLGDMVKRYLCMASFRSRGSCHVFRHACATHMLEGGADIRYIQSMLGHSHLSTTQIYTHVSMDRLARVHRRSHPSCARAWPLEQ